MRFSLPPQRLPTGSELPVHHARGNRRPILSVTSLISIVTVVYLFVYVYFRRVSARDPTSYFFDRRYAFQRGYSTHRIQQADSFVEQVNHDTSLIKGQDGSPYMCIGVATVARRGQQYVSTTIGSILEGLSVDERRAIFLNVLVAHSDVSKHPDASAPWMKTLPDRVLHYDMAGPDIDQIIAWEKGGWYRNKTIYDYTYLLNDCYKTNAAYIVMVEDDTLAMQGWYPRTVKALDTVVARMQSRNAGKWAYLRLFYVEDLLGWNSEEWPRYLFWSFFVWAVLSFGLLVARKKLCSPSDAISHSSMLMISAVFIPLGIGLHFMAGRQTMWPIATGVHEMNRFGCCSQALVFPRAIVPLILSDSDLTTDWLVDMMIEKIADKEQLDRWVTVPALFQHIGSTSSKGHGFDDNARELWNFRFEDHPF